VAQRSFRYSGKDVDGYHIVVHRVVRAHAAAVAVVAVEALAVVVYAEAYACELGIVAAAESVEIVGRALAGTVAAPQEVFEKDSHFLHHRPAVGVAFGGYLQGCDEVFLAVGAHFAYGKLRACDYDRFFQSVEHERQGRGRIGHSVGAVQDYESVVSLIVFGNYPHDVLPVGRAHVAGVDGRVELDVVYHIVEHLHLRHIVHKVREVERTQSLRGLVFDHGKFIDTLSQVKI
jgi:hypothetical protein